MFFASFFDISFVPFYAFSAYISHTSAPVWTTIFSNPEFIHIFTTTVFYCAAVGSGFFLISFGLSIYLTVTFNKICDLPPDMNPLEDNLTSRHKHKRNKSSISTATTISEKRISAPLSNRSSATAYDDFVHPPTMSFLQTRMGSTDSFSTYRPTPPPSRDSRLDLPSRQYQIKNHSARNSMIDLKRSSYLAPSVPKRASYAEIPLSDTGLDGPPRQIGKMDDAWFSARSLNSSKQSRASSPVKGSYRPLEQSYDSSENVSLGHPNPLEANPPTPRHSVLLNRDSPLSEISNNRLSGDIADMSSSQVHEMPSIRDFKAKRYGELRAATPPVLVGTDRQVSSGADYSGKGGFRAKNRDVSGKVAEEGRAGEKGEWRTRFRKISGMK